MSYQLTKTTAFIVVALSILVLSGCGSKNPKTYKVSGKVTFNGGEMPGDGNIYFISTDGTGSRGIGDFNSSGQFRISTWKPGDGLRPGTYNVVIECLKTPRTGVSDGTSYIHRKFNDPNHEVSGLAQVTVENKAITNLVFDVCPPEVEEVEVIQQSSQPKYTP
ncbi:MAG: hypothetical protein ACRC2T_04290 [Thermoguttaceae bacterium]